MKKLLLSFLALLFCAFISGKNYSLKSPDGKTEINVNAGSEIKWSATYNNNELVKASRIGLELKSGKILGDNEKVLKADFKKINETITPVIPYKKALIQNNCNILELSFKSNFSVEFRAYNDGIAYRFKTKMDDELIIRNEILDFCFSEGSHSWYPLEESFMSHNERTFIYSSLDTIGKDHLASLPALFQIDKMNVLITESDITDYPGMWLTGRNSGKMSAIWPKYPETEELRGDRNEFVTATKGYIAETKGSRTYPWRVFIIAENDISLLDNDLVYRLARPTTLKNTDWIKPGQVAWDWWNANNIYGVDFRAGINNETYKYYIDFAAANGLEYIILDEGWYVLGNVTKEVPGINVYELCEYAAKKNVGVILWVVWKSFQDKMDEAFDLYQKWGVKGLKIDFMQRDDQKMVDFYLETARNAAEHQMLVDFHGAYKPDGMMRTWPNLLTREGVKGMENSKWSRDANPEHDVTLPYTRMVAGPMDYTPGAMVNMDRTNFSPAFTRPQSLGTRAHQVAMYVIYESPLQMLSDSPSNYMKEQETTDFISNIPVVWDDIACLDGKVGDFIVLARRSGKDWFVGAMTDWTERTIDIDFSFLPAGNYNVKIYQDGINADSYAGDYKIIDSTIKSGGRLRVHMAPGGGWAARLTPEK
ncbi:MAG TPA: glycoside hydrolase family 97 protein [Bacteroidales bacterium]|nr:glycoside hydrolase family 97 protein [Bacteroidales bacterium]